MPACLRCLIAWSCLLLAMAGARAAEPSVVLVSSELSPAYVELADALVTELERGGVPGSEVRRTTVAELATAESTLPKLYVALGVRAATALAQIGDGVPVLCTLLPRASFERILLETGRKASSHFSAIYLDQPLSRQLELVRLTLPRAKRIGVLWGESSVAQQAALDGAAASRGLRVVSARVGPAEPLFPALRKVLDESDVLLALADPQIYHGGTIQNILMTSIRAGIPMVAFSPAYVRAGALAAVHVTPAQIGQQAGGLARAVLQGRALPSAPLYSREFEVSVNVPVAHALALSLDPVALAARLRLLERAP